MDKKQIVRVIIKKTQLACAFTEKADMCYYGKNTACVIMEKKRQIPCLIMEKTRLRCAKTEKRQIACVIMEKKRQIASVIMEKRRIACVIIQQFYLLKRKLGSA